MLRVSASRRLFDCVSPAIVFSRALKRKPPPPGKPPCLPPAKSKRYRVVQVPWQNADEVRELLWRRHAYMDALMSLRAHFRRELATAGTLVEGRRPAPEVVEVPSDFDDPVFLERLRDNDAENERLAEARATRVRAERGAMETRLAAEVDAWLSEEDAERLAGEEAVCDAIERCRTEFVTVETLEERVVEAIENPVEFNFAIDKAGGIYRGTQAQKYVSAMPLSFDKPLTQASAPAIKSGQLDERKDEAAVQ